MRLKKLVIGAAAAAALVVAAAPAAQAVGPGPDGYVNAGTVYTEIAWKGANCINAWVGGRYGGVVPITLCGGSATYTERGPFSSGRWVGMDPEMSGATEVGCAVFVNGTWQMGDWAAGGDGTEVTCLEQV